MQSKLSVAGIKLTSASRYDFHHVLSSASTLPHLLSNSFTKTMIVHHVNYFPLHRPRFVGLRESRSSNNGINPEEAREDDQPKLTTMEPGPDDDDDDDQLPGLLQLGNSAILPACFVGLFTGIAVVLFNYTVTNLSSSFSNSWPTSLNTL